MASAVERYTVLDEIGHGGMATVYRARDTTLDRLIALKVLHPHLQRTPEARARFTREAKSVAKLRHPNILEIFDYSGEGSDQTFIATELLTGPTLKDFVLEGPEVPAEIAACITLQVAEALELAHQKGIIHRDVKPENVLLHENRCVKLTDFGIAHMSDAHTFTATGQVLGSPGHMAPEQVETGHCDARSDVFSLGTVLYFVSVGRLPFIGRNAHHLLKQLLEGEYPDPLRLRPAVGKHLKDIIDRALALNPDHRYQDASAFADALRAFLAHSGVTDPNATLESYLADPENQRTSIYLMAVEALLERASSSSSQSDIPEAHAALNRVLALDEGNERALKLLATLGRRGQVKRRIAVLLSLLGVVACAAVAYAAWTNSQPTADTGGVDQPGVGSAIDVKGADSQKGDVDDTQSSASGDAQADVGGDATRGDDTATRKDSDQVARGGEEATTQDGAQAQDKPASDKAVPTTKKETVRAKAERRIKIIPTPTNMEIKIGNGPYRSSGDYFREGLSLKPGKYQVKARGAGNCCKPYSKQRTIPPGSGEYELKIELEWRNTGIILKGPTPPGLKVRVSANGKRVRGVKIDEIASIPMRTKQATALVSIKAPGYKPYEATVRLEAGKPTVRHFFNLEKTDETP